MGRTSQRKGRRGEIELSEKLSAYGYSVTPGASMSFGGVPDVTGLPGIHIEVKRRECPDILAALQQAATDAERFGDGLPVVFWRRNRGKWVAFLTLESVVADPAAQDAFTEAEESVWRGQLHDALEAGIEKLSPRQAEIIRDFCWRNRTLTEIGRERGVSKARAGQLKQEGLSRLARSAALRQFVETRTPYYNRVGVEAFRRTGESATERAVFARERLTAHFSA